MVGKSYENQNELKKVPEKVMRAKASRILVLDYIPIERIREAEKSVIATIHFFDSFTELREQIETALKIAPPSDFQPRCEIYMINPLTSVYKDSLSKLCRVRDSEPRIDSGTVLFIILPEFNVVGRLITTREPVRYWYLKLSLV